MKHYEVEILDARTREKLCFLDKVEPHATIAEIKSLFTKAHPQWYPARQSLRLDPKPARGHHRHLLLPRPGRPDQLGDDPVPHPQPLHVALPPRLLPQLHLRG
uniref:Trans-2,3-enoyl-CoA reductase-like n=1 Tax=Calidris pygmaea TaxID=425635 RepID=A0A8C3PL53_9CHAR